MALTPMETPSRLTETDLARLEELAKKATPGVRRVFETRFGPNGYEDAMGQRPTSAYTREGFPILVSGDKEVLRRDPSEGEYLSAVDADEDWEFFCGMAPQSILGLIALARDGLAAKGRFEAILSEAACLPPLGLKENVANRIKELARSGVAL